MNLVKLKDIQRKQPAFWNVGIIIEILHAPFISVYVILDSLFATPSSGTNFALV